MYGQKSPSVRKGRQSGGTSVYYRNCLKDKISVVENNKFGIIWLKPDRNLFVLNEDIYIYLSHIHTIG